MVGWLDGLKGIGPVTAWTLRAEVGRCDRFRTGKQLARYCGLSPCNRSSGVQEADAGLIRAANPERRRVCFDEGGKQLSGDVRPPLPRRPGQPRREDYEYERHGTANLFMGFEPWAGARRVEVTERRTNPDFARIIRRLVDEWYPEAEQVVLVQDNLSTPSPAALYEAFAAARRLVETLAWPYPPKHGSGLNVAEMEVSVLARQCLDRRTPDLETLRREVAAGERERNAAVVKVDWQFTTADARVKLKRLYPTIERHGTTSGLLQLR